MNKGQSVLVNEHTWVDISIGGYKDKLICDIFPMDACHLLLGRPWKYKRGVIYDGKENTISFKKDGRTFKIQSLMEEEEPKSKTPSVLLRNGKDFFNILQQGGEVYVIMVQPNEEEKTMPTPIPEEVQNSLGKFKDIISDGTLAKLPPKRYISH